MSGSVGLFTFLFSQMINSGKKRMLLDMQITLSFLPYSDTLPVFSCKFVRQLGHPLSHEKRRYHHGLIITYNKERILWQRAADCWEEVLRRREAEACSSAQGRAAEGSLPPLSFQLMQLIPMQRNGIGWATAETDRCCSPARSVGCRQVAVRLREWFQLGVWYCCGCEAWYRRSCALKFL